jgi:LacI family transcriptional regulator
MVYGTPTALVVQYELVGLLLVLITRARPLEVITLVKTWRQRCRPWESEVVPMNLVLDRRLDWSYKLVSPRTSGDVSIRRRSGPRNVAILIETNRVYGRGMLEGIIKYNRANGPWSIYFEPHGLHDPPPPWLSAWRGDGILLARIDDERMIQAVRATHLPVVDLRNRWPHLGFPVITVDNRLIAKLGAEHLLSRSFRQFGWFGLPPGEHVHMDERGDWFVKQINEAGFPCDVFPANPQQRHLSWEQQQEEIVRWVQRLPKPAGVMCGNDDRGQQLLNACLLNGIHVPEEVAVLGVNNDPFLCNLSTPPLSSIDVNPRQIGWEAAALLDRMMDGQKPPKDPIEVEPGPVFTRQSSDILAIEDRDIAWVTRFIREKACEGIGVEDVLKAYPVARSTLQRKMKQFLGRTLIEEILRVRIERARILLAETSDALDVIAHKAGFSSGKYFGDVFYRATGVRPTTYREHHQRGTKPLGPSV